MWGRSASRAAKSSTVPGRAAAQSSRHTASDDLAETGGQPFGEICRRYQAALDGVGEGIVICDADGEVVFRNAAAELHLSSVPTDALAVQAVTEVIGGALAGESAEKRLDLVSPSRRSLKIQAFPIVAEGRIDGAVAVVEDISERLRLEGMRRDFVANVSHELKTPTGALTLLAETIDGEDDPAIVRRLVRRMGTEADRLGRIIDDLLDLSRIEANEAPQKRLVPVKAVVSEAVESLQTVAANLEVDLGVGTLPSGLSIPGDRRDLVSAVVNLVDNGIKYSESGGEVQISAIEVPEGVEISVVDHGVGIPSRDLERIFERFYRVDRARSRATGGTGLGLSIVRHIAANHGGSVRVSSVEGHGSTFVLSLPAVPAGAPRDPEKTGARGRITRLTAPGPHDDRG
jgi:two-component system sensor histidine kinase SenX3